MRQKARVKRSHPMTLTEVLVAFGLMAIIFTYLFSTFKTLSLLSLHSSQGKEIVFMKKELQERLSTLLIQAQADSFSLEQEEEDGPYSLSFTYDNQVDHDPNFCHFVRASIFLDADHSVVLETQSLKNNNPELPIKSRREVLLPGIIHMDFSLKKLHPLADNPELIEITLEDGHSDSPMQYAFFLPKIDEKKGILLP